MPSSPPPIFPRPEEQVKNDLFVLQKSIRTRILVATCYINNVERLEENEVP